MLPETQEWLECGAKLVFSDVVKWTETIWPEKKRRKARQKAQPLGKRLTIAQVLEIDSAGFVRLSVIRDEIIENKHGMPLRVSAYGAIIVKRLTTIARGEPQRLKWKDEAQRSIEISVFLS
jgi:hypothetical protein